MLKCPACGWENLANALFCEECAYPLYREEAGKIRLVSSDGGWELQVPALEEILIGRSDPQQGFKPHVDLSAYGGLERGVSRRHARIMRREDGFYIEDLDSVNGTMLNGQLLTPFEPRALHSGDELRLGGVVLRVLLESDT